MPISSLNSAVVVKYRIPLMLILIVAGLAGNYFKAPLFLDIDFLFGSIFAMLALQLFGLGRGILIGAMIAAYTYVLWNHPYAIIIMTAEVAVVGWLVERRRVEMVLADALYWVVIGMPLVYFFYHGVMHASVSNTFVTMTKQAVNGLASALMARLLFIAYSHWSRSSLTSYKDLAYNLMAFFALCPALGLLVLSSRTDFNEIDRSIRAELTHCRESMGSMLEDWVSNRKLAIISLAEMAISRNTQEMQPYLEAIRKSDVSFARIGLLDKTATIVAYSPLIDDQGKSSIGISAADRPYLAFLKQSLKPMFSEVVMGRVGAPQPRVFILAPIVINSEFSGYAIGVLNLDQIHGILDKHSESNTTLYTVLDKNSNVIMSNRLDLTMMQPFVRQGGTLNRLDAEMSQWIPTATPNTPVAERWRRSFYVTEFTIDKLSGWKLILEQPVAPYQKYLYDNYTGKLSLLLLIVLGALALAELLSRRFISTLDKLRQVTHDLPMQLTTNNKEIAWPESQLLETNHLINNFRAMSDSLVAQFNEIHRVNQSLEQRVRERTEELRESTEQYRSILTASPDNITITDMEGRILMVSPAGLTMFGYDREEEGLGRSVTEFIAPEDQGRALSNLALRLQGVLQGPSEYRGLRLDGSILDLEVNFNFIQGIDGQPAKIVFIVRDISQRKQMERALEQSETRLKLALQANQNAVWDGDLLTNEFYCSPHWWNMIGYAENELEVEPEFLSRLVHPDDLERANRVVGEAMEGDDNIFQGEIRLLHKKGHYIPVLTRGLILRDTESRPVRISGTNTDLTERKKIEETKRQFANQLQQIEKMESLNRMAGAIAHNFNNLLGATMGYLEIAREDLPSEGRIYKYVTSAFRAAERAAEVSGMMLTYLGQSINQRINQDLSEVCLSNLPMLKDLVRKDLILATDFPSPGPMVNVDSNYILQLLRNLVVNASEALQGEQGTITLTVRTVSSVDIPLAPRFPADWQSQGDFYACLTVKDTGSGIATKDIEKLFDPFFSSKFAGRGLGLAMVLGILRSHDGMVTVESDLGRGSVFKVYLPVSDNRDDLLS